MIKVPESAEILLCTHLGLGDQIISNAIVRAAVQAYGKVALPVKASNMESVGFMFRDLEGLLPVKVPDKWHRGGERYMMDMERKWKGCSADLTMFNRPKEWVSTARRGGEFDKNFYRWAGMGIKEKFRGFHVERDKSVEVPVPEGNYILLHDTAEFAISARALPINSGIPILHVHDFEASNIFSLWGVIENATEIHMINSGPLNLTDFLKPKGKLFWHRGARKEISYPTLQMDWKILD